MKTVIKIAWRNIWRNKLRSLTVIVSMVLGLFSGLFAVSMMLGLNNQRMDSAVDSYLSHIQIHHPSFSENFDINHTVKNFDSLKISLKNDKSVKAFSSRTIISGMASTAHGSAVPSLATIICCLAPRERWEGSGISKTRQKVGGWSRSTLQAQ